MAKSNAIPAGLKFVDDESQPTSHAPAGLKFVEEPTAQPSASIAQQLEYGLNPEHWVMGTEKGGIYGNILPRLEEGAANVGQNLYNNISNILKEVAKGTGLSQVPPFDQSAISPSQSPVNYGEVLGVPKSEQDSFVTQIPQIALGIAAPETLPAQVSIGALTSKDPMQGAIGFGLGHGIAKSLEMVGKGINSAGEFLNPKKATQNTISSIKNYFENAKNAQQNAYGFTDPYKDQQVLSPEEAKNLVDQNDLQFLSPKAKKLYKGLTNQVEGANGPTFQNLHQFQSQLFSDAQGLNQKDMANRYAAQAMGNIRQDILDNHLLPFLQEKDPLAALKYNEGRDITRNQLAPFSANQKLAKIGKGTITDMNPSGLTGLISKMLENEQIGLDHPIAQAANQLQKKVNRGIAWQTGLPLAGYFGLRGAQDMSPMGLAAMEWMEPRLVKGLIQNPYVIEKAQNVNKGVQAISKILSSEIANKKNAGLNSQG